MVRYGRLPLIAALGLLGIADQVNADHPTIAFGSEAAGPIGTIPTAPLPVSTWSAGLRTEEAEAHDHGDSSGLGFVF